jgi:hypothetical protein
LLRFSPNTKIRRRLRLNVASCKANSSQKYQIPPDLVVKYQPIDIVDVILWRVLRPRFVLQREIKGRATLTP